MSIPEVSIIVPNYNHETFLKSRLDSIINQNFKDFELIILDDCSTDLSGEIISEYQSLYPDLISFYPSETNSGSPYIQWDKGISIAKGKFIWIAESDDLASIHFLEHMVPILKENDNVSIVCCRSNAIDDRGHIISDSHPIFNGFENALFTDKTLNQKYFKGKEFISNLLFQRCLIPNVSGILIKKSCYNEVSGINLKFKRSGDYDLYLRILENSDIIYYNNTLNSTRYHDSKLTAKNTINSFHERYIILKRIFRNHSIATQSKLNAGNFYFKVYTYDIFLNENINPIAKLKCFYELAELFPHLKTKFFQLLLSRVKINLSKSLNV